MGGEPIFFKTEENSLEKLRLVNFGTVLITSPMERLTGLIQPVRSATNVSQNRANEL